jgi:hypothetical protein
MFRQKKVTTPEHPHTLWRSYEQFYGNRRYTTDTATILASHKGKWVCFAEYGEIYLCKTPKGAYFHLSCQFFSWKTSISYSLIPYTQKEAIKAYHHLPDHHCSFKEAFDIDIEDA